MDFSYQDYLDKWADKWADQNSGEFVWFRRGAEHTKIYKKMNEAEFTECVKKFSAYREQLDQMTKEERFDSEYDRLLDKSFFECELPLFF